VSLLHPGTSAVWDPAKGMDKAKAEEEAVDQAALGSVQF
jgi:hypothetical protein